MESVGLRSNEFAEWMTLLKSHIECYPAMTAQDVYKLLYQGIMGPEHIMPSAQTFIARLEEEIAGLAPGPDEALLESIRPDGALSRVHLRSWLALGQDIARLADACLQAGRRSWGGRQELLSVWGCFCELVQEGCFATISPLEATTLQGWLEGHDFPAVHHSETYRALYRPAYRLVDALFGWRPNPKGFVNEYPKI